MPIEVFFLFKETITNIVIEDRTSGNETALPRKGVGERYAFRAADNEGAANVKISGVNLNLQYVTAHKRLKDEEEFEFPT